VRPVRPLIARYRDLDTAHYPPSERVVHKPVDTARHAAFAASIREIPPERR